MNSLVTFNDTSIELINKNNQLYMTGDQIGRALEYTDNSKISHLYNAHKSEFTDEMSILIKYGRTRVRIFNREGAWLIGMFARTPKAAEFRKWVLKVLGAVADNQVAPIPSLTQDRDALKAIGGIVKSVVRSELSNHLIAYFANEESLPKWKAMFKRWMRDSLKEEITSMLAGDSYKSIYPTSDDDLIKCLWSWYATHHKKTFDAIREITAENDRLKCKLATIKKAVN